MEETLGKRIAACRKKLGLTQDQLAEQLGVTAQAVSKWENDQSCPDIATLPRLAEIFGISVDALLGREPPQPVHETEVIYEDADDDDDDDHVWDFHFHADDNKRHILDRSAIGFAVLVLLVGCLVLSSKLLSWQVSFWNILWPSALLVFGFTELTKRFSFFSLGCGLFGGYFLLDNIGVLNLNLGTEILFPVALILFGVSLLVDALWGKKAKKKNKKPFSVGTSKDQPQEAFRVDGEVFDCATSFGSSQRSVILARMSGGSAKVNFGELNLDLTGVETVAPGCTLRASCSFGELVLLIPRKFLVDLTESTTFASVSMEGQPDSRPVGTIRVNADTSFGEICIRYV